MRDEGYTLEPAAEQASPPFSQLYTPRRRRAFWTVHDATGRRVGRSNTRAGARAAVRAIYALAGGANG